MNFINSETPPASGIEFSQRLITALEYRGFSTLRSQIVHITTTAGCSSTTARRWLNGRVNPNRILYRGGFLSLCESLGAGLGWLVLGDGYSPIQTHIINGLQRMNEWEITKFLRLLIRLRNNDAKALRLARMCDQGQISRQQFFSMM